MSQQAQRRLALKSVITFACTFSAYIANGQSQVQNLNMRGPARLQQSDMAVLELQEPRHDLSCVVSPIKPELDFDFTFHTGYQVKVSIADLAGEGNELTILFRVIPEDHPDDPTYMLQRIHVPAIENGRGGVGEFFGIFTLGEGRYHVDWLMRDLAEHVCATSWNLEIKPNSKDIPVRQWIPQAQARPVGPLFREEPPVAHDSGRKLWRVAIIVNFDPQNPTSAQLRPRDVEDLVAILRRISSDPRIGSYSVKVCSLEAQQVLFEQDDVSQIDLPALGQSLKLLKLGIADAKRLATKNSSAQFATDIIGTYMTKQGLDALIVLGPKVDRGGNASIVFQGAARDQSIPVFYLGYTGPQQRLAWGDPISTIVKHLRGFEYKIRQPRDLFTAWSDVVSHITQGNDAAKVSRLTQDPAR